MIAANELPRVVMLGDEPEAPSVPVEVPIVAAAFGISETIKRAEWLLFAIRFTPREEQTIRNRFAEVQMSFCEAWADFDKYAEIRSCKGSA